jgi:NAD(P)-dependent dehydrogenase (short-subunit alcohol dehydrogenase family)
MKGTIVVTGASGNLGTAVCQRLLQVPGARVLALVHRESSRASLARKLGTDAGGSSAGGRLKAQAEASIGGAGSSGDGLKPEAEASIGGAGSAGDGLKPEAEASIDVRVADLGSEASVAAAFEGAGTIHGAVNCAGGWKGGASVSQTSLETFDQMIALNLRSAFVVSREALRRGARRIVNVASFTAAQLGGMSGSAAYNASKAAVIALTKAIAEEGADSHVRCNCVAPGTLRTRENEQGMPRADPSGWVPLEQVAEAIVFLLGPESDAVNGAVLTLPSR